MATVTKQGEEYEEDSVLEEYDGEGDEDTDSKLTSLFGIPIKFLIIGGAVLILILIGVIVFMFRGSSSDDIVLPDAQVEQPITDVGMEAPSTTPTAPISDTSTSTEDTTNVWSDAQGSIAGFTEGTAEGTEVSLNGEVIGTLSFTSGTPVTNDTGMSAYINTGVSAIGSDNTIEVNDINMELRKLGYTGDEIAAAQSSGADLNAMVESARALRDQEAKEALIRMSDSASEEFQYILNHSIYCLPEIEFPEVINAPGRTVQDNSYTVNADYEKLDLRGNQLFIKLKIANDTYAFMTTTPQRWAALPPTGNMVVRIDYVLYGMSDSALQFYIKDIQELDVSQITVNPEDSATNIEDIIDTSGGTAVEDVE